LRRSRPHILSVLLALGLVALAGRVRAFEKTGSFDGIDYRFICVDWALLKEKINALVILSRPPGDPGGTRTVRLALDFPAAAFRSAFESPGAGSGRIEASLEIGPGETKRFAFKGLEAIEETGPATHPFELGLAAGEGKPEASRFEVETIRGPLVPRGVLSILVPALLSLLAIPVFILFLRRRGEPGGWRTVKDAEIDKPEEAWWAREEPAGEPDREGTP